MVIIDLDNTLLNCNSFTQFVKFLFKRFPEIRMRLFWIVVYRKLRIISHVEAKEIIMAIAATVVSGSDLDDFVSFLCKKIDNRIRKLAFIKSDAILATAAPELYVGKFAEKIGVHRFCASASGKPENRGRRKLENVVKNGAIFNQFTIVITDHWDDIPLLKANSSGKNIVKRPSLRTRMALRKEGIKYYGWY